VKIAELSDSSFEGKNVTFYGEGIKTYTLTPYTYFQGVKPQPRGSTSPGIAIKARY